MRRWTPGPLTIRVRLGVAMAVALLPVLLLGAAQSAIAFHKEGVQRRAELVAAADRSVANARARLDSAIVVLQTVTPGTVGVHCAPTLRALMTRMPGVLNMARLNRYGRVACAADSVMGDSSRRQDRWFQRLAAGEQAVLDAAPHNGYVNQPALLVATRAQDEQADFDGALVAFFSLSN